MTDPPFPGIELLVSSDGLLQPLDLHALFGNTHPVELDIGCGTGRFLVQRAETTPELNLLGIERLLGRIRRVAAKAAARGLQNVRLLRVEAGYALAHMLPDASITTITIAFPDPWPKRRHHRRRLLQPETVASLHRVLVPGGRLYFATDHQDYFESARRLFLATQGWTHTAPFIPEPEAQSSFEQLWSGLGREIYRFGFRKAHEGDR